MKLLIITPYSLPKMGGVERYSYELGMKLKEKYRLDVVLVSSNWDRQENKYRVIENGLKIYKLPYLFKISTTPINPFWRTYLRRIIEYEKPDVINGHLPVPYIADISARVAQKKHIPYILTYHNDLTGHAIPARMFAGPYNLLMGRRTLELADLITATSSRYVEQSESLRDFQHKIRIVPPGVDTSLFFSKRTGKLRRTLGIVNEKVVLFVGQLNKASQHKGLDNLILAFDKVSRSIDARLVVIGWGDFIQHYKEMAKRLGILDKINFLGQVPNDDLALFYSDSDVLVLPSVDQTEGFGMVLMEAQACGVPVIGSNVGGIPCALEDGRTGLLIPPSDVESLSQALLRVLGDEDYSRYLGSNGIEWINKHFSWEAVSEIFYRSVLEVLPQ